MKARKLARALSLLLALPLLGASLAADAQQYPSKTVTLIVPFAPGGPVDFVARLLAAKLAAPLGQSLVVENRAGAGGYIGGEAVARSAPDGHTLLVQVLEGVHTQLFTKDQATVLSRELSAVALLAFAPNLYIGPASGAKDLREFIAQAKANPKKINVSLIPGNASALEVMSFLKQQSLDVLVVPYNSMTPVVTAMSRDEAHLYLATVGSAKPLIDAGKIRGLAVFTERRVPALPDVPTLKELGLAYTVADGINYSVFAPAKTPGAVIRVLNEKIVAVMDSAETRELLGKQGFVTGSPSAEEWQAKFVTLTRAVERAAKEAGVVPQ